MRTTSRLLILFALGSFAVLGVQVYLLAKMTVSPQPAAMSSMNEQQVADLERRAAQVDVRLKEIQALLKDRPSVRRVDDEEPENQASAPIEYKKWVAVIVATQGTAVVEFTEEFERGVAYHFRCFVPGQETELAGSGKVVEKYDRLPGEKPGTTLLVNDGGELFIEAGPIKVEWSYARSGKGYIYYEPLTARVYLAPRSAYAKLDLSRFGR